MGYLNESGFDRFVNGLKIILDKKAKSTDLSETNNTLANLQTNHSNLAADVDKLQTNIGNLQTAVKRIRYVDVWLPTSGWSDSAPYTLTASEPDVTEDWVPGIPVLLHDSNVDIPWILRSIEALECIKMITSAAGTLTFTAPEDKPSTPITLRVPGMFR